MKIVPFSLAVVAVLAVGAAFAQEKQQKDVVKSTHTFTGKVTGFEVGDYMHVMLVDSKGKTHSYFLGADGLDFYCAVNAKKTGTFTYQVIETFIPEAGGRQTIEQLSNAKVGKVDYKTWWASEKKKMSRDKLESKYRPLVDKLTKN